MPSLILDPERVKGRGSGGKSFRWEEIGELIKNLRELKNKM